MKFEYLQSLKSCVTDAPGSVTLISLNLNTDQPQYMCILIIFMYKIFIVINGQMNGEP
jgi:hypothetical protein